MFVRLTVKIRVTEDDSMEEVTYPVGTVFTARPEGDEFLVLCPETGLFDLTVYRNECVVIGA